MKSSERSRQEESLSRSRDGEAGASLIESMGDPEAGAAQQYREMFVGDSSLAALLRYELLISLTSSIPGAAGYLARKLAYPRVFDAVGPGTVFGEGMRIRCPSRIRVGANVTIDDNVVLDAKGAADTSWITVGDDVLIGRNTLLSCTSAHIEIGDHVSMGPNCYLTTKGSIVVGSNVSIGPYTALIGAGHEITDPNKPAILQDRTAEGVVIEEGVWLGAGVRVLDGVRIGENSIVAAGAVVTEDVPDAVIAGGVPATTIRPRGG